MTPKVSKTNETRAKLTLLRPQDSLRGRETSSIPRQGEVAKRKRHNLSGHDQIVAKVGKPHETRGTFQKQTVLLRQANTKLPETSDEAKAVERKQSHTQTERKPTPSVNPSNNPIINNNGQSTPTLPSGQSHHTHHTTTMSFFPTFVGGTTSSTSSTTATTTTTTTTRLSQRITMADQLLLRPHYNYKLEFKRGRQEMHRRFWEDGLVELGIIQALQRHPLRTSRAYKEAKELTTRVRRAAQGKETSHAVQLQPWTRSCDQTYSLYQHHL